MDVDGKLSGGVHGEAEVLGDIAQGKDVGQRLGVIPHWKRNGEAMVDALLGCDVGAAIGVEGEGGLPGLDVGQQGWVVE